MYHKIKLVNKKIIIYHKKKLVNKSCKYNHQSLQEKVHLIFQKVLNKLSNRNSKLNKYKIYKMTLQ